VQLKHLSTELAVSGIAKNEKAFYFIFELFDHNYVCMYVCISLLAGDFKYRYMRCVFTFYRSIINVD